jgi:hypothetical protein
MTERRVRRGLLNEGGDSVAKNEEEEQELHVPTVNQSCDKERNLHFLRRSTPDGERFSQALNGRFLCFSSKSVEV